MVNAILNSFFMFKRLCYLVSIENIGTDGWIHNSDEEKIKNPHVTESATLDSGSVIFCITLLSLIIKKISKTYYNGLFYNELFYNDFFIWNFFIMDFFYMALSNIFYTDF